MAAISERMRAMVSCMSRMAARMLSVLEAAEEEAEDSASELFTDSVTSLRTSRTHESICARRAKKEEENKPQRKKRTGEKSTESRPHEGEG